MEIFDVSIHGRIMNTDLKQDKTELMNFKQKENIYKQEVKVAHFSNILN